MTLGDSNVVLSRQDVYNIAELQLTFANTEPADEITISIPEVQSYPDSVGTRERLIGLGLGRVSLIQD